MTTIELQLTQGQAVLFDEADLPLVAGLRWQAWRAKPTQSFYAVSNGLPTGRRRQSSGTRIYMHRLLLPGDHEVDHVDGDGLNNRRSNLRPATSSQNKANRRRITGASQFKGVSLVKRSADRGYPSPWRAYIKVDGRQRELGHFRTAEDAARAYDTAALETFGEFAATNEQMGLLT